MERTSVLVLGGSLVGLSASLFLSWRGVPHILVDKHHGSSAHPRAIGFTETTLEHFRTVGIADRIPQVTADQRLRRVKVTSLAGEWHEETQWTPGKPQENTGEFSPCTGSAISQDKLEPILRNAALELGADMRLGVELVSFEQTGDAVIAHLRPRDGSPEYKVSADYMIAADGAESETRKALGITRSGVGHLRTLRSVLFRCREADGYLGRGYQQFEIVQPDFSGFLTTYGDGRWVLMFDDDRDRREDELCASIERALGRKMPFEIITTGRWDLAGQIADRYASGRVFLAGDAAHQLPPTRGGFGANTGIDDVWNLAWKLDRVIKGTSSPALLDTYEAERRPIGWLRHQQTFSRPDYSRSVGKDFVADPLFSNEAMEFGQMVRSPAIMGAGSTLPAAASPVEWAGQPGTRAPHVLIERDGGPGTTLDLFGRGYVLLAAAGAWRTAADGLSLDVVVIGDVVVSVERHSLNDRFGIGDIGATLVRPDGVVAWRTTDAASTAALRTAFERVAFTINAGGDK
ncbi:2,4-dichlorophenol 6-monooxygenase [bacterium]|nr:2,4-dichlorophenol 6-monooxygenase [bacterium]